MGSLSVMKAVRNVYFILKNNNYRVIGFVLNWVYIDKFLYNYNIISKYLQNVLIKCNIIFLLTFFF